MDKQLIDEGKVTTTKGYIPEGANLEAGAPEPVGENGQHKSYWVLSESERAKGFVRPVRSSYIHVGIAGPKFPLTDLTPEQIELFGQHGYVKFETYPPGYHGSATGRYWTQEQLNSVGRGCQTSTRMGQAIAETYARDPHFYGYTFCVKCNKHLKVGEDGEFVWEDGSRVGT